MNAEANAIEELGEYILEIHQDGEKLEEYVNSRAYMTAIIGPLGSGKTTASAGTVFDRICEQPVDRSGVRRSRWCAIRNTENDLRSTTIKDWLDIIPKDLGRFVGSAPITHYMNFEGIDGIEVESEMIFLPLDLEGAVKKLRGFQLTGVWFNEIKELMEKIVRLGLGRTGRYPKKSQMPKGVRYWYGGIGDSNAPDDDHWLHNAFEEDTPKNWKCVKQPGGVIRDPNTGLWVMNPAAENARNLDEDYYKNQMEGAKDAWIRVELANQYGTYSDGDPVHPEYNEDVHASWHCDYIPSLPVYVGMDFGRTPAAAIFQEVAGGYQVFDEFLMDAASAVRFAPELKLYLAKEHGITEGVSGGGDPSGGDGRDNTEDTAIEIVQAHGFAVYETDTNDTITRRAALTGPLTRIRTDGKPAFLVHKRCKKLRKALGGRWYYRRLQIKSGADESYANEAFKNAFSHIGEAMEYGLMARGEGPMVQNARPRRTRAPRGWRN